MYGNSNQYWKKTANTTNVEVVIDDPSQIQDTYITNRQIFQDIVVFDITANDFVYQPTSNSIQNAVSGANGSGESETNTIMYMFGSGSGDSDIGGGGGVGDQGLQGGGGIGGGLGTLRRGATGGTVDIPTRNPECLQFIEGFNRFLKLFEELKLPSWSLGIPGFAAKWRDATKWWLGRGDPLPNTPTPFHELLVCLMINSPRLPDGTPGPFYGGPRAFPSELDLDYIRRVLGRSLPPNTPIALDIPFILRMPPFVPDFFPPIPELPAGSGGAGQTWEQWLDNHPNLLEQFDRDARRALEKIKEALDGNAFESFGYDNMGPPEVFSPWLEWIPEECRELAKEFLKQIADDLLRVLQMVDVLLRLKKEFDMLKASPCWDQLNMDEEFNTRKIGRFDTLGKFFEWVNEYFRKFIDNPFHRPDTNTKPFEPMSDAQATRYINDLFGDTPLQQRVEIASREYENWLNEPETKFKSIFPPIKALFRTLDDRKDIPNSTDQDAYTLLFYYSVLYQFTGYREYASLFTEFDVNDAIANLTSFLSQTTESFVPPRFTA